MCYHKLIKIYYLESLQQSMSSEQLQANQQSNKTDSSPALQESASNKISRRDFLKKGGKFFAALGAAATLPGLSTACNPESKSSDTVEPPETQSPQPEKTTEYPKYHEETPSQRVLITHPEKGNHLRLSPQIDPGGFNIATSIGPNQELTTTHEQVVEEENEIQIWYKLERQHEEQNIYICAEQIKLANGEEIGRRTHVRYKD
jgi:hypothetical protein